MYLECFTNILIGFSAYLQELDPEHRSWQWQIQHTVIYCTVHFKRGII